LGGPFLFFLHQGFAEFLERKNLIVNVRRSRGKDIDAACGQLANKNEVAE
jgi:23S rRNA (adenine2503-C2)-methyltransferase